MLHGHILSRRSLIALTAAGLCGTAVGSQQAPGPVTGAVYTMTNEAMGNSVLALHRTAHGELLPGASYATGGLGTSSGLGNQGGVTLTPDNRWLLAVNAGSDQLSVFAVNRSGLLLTDIVDSGGLRPISVTVHRDLVYVLNAGGAAGGSDEICGFRLGVDGSLTPLAGSVRSLSSADTGPAQVGFSPSGGALVVTEKATNMVDVFPIGSGGRPESGTFHPSPGDTPFGFSFGHRGRLFVSEAFGGAPGASTASSYDLSRSGNLVPVTSALPTTQSAACWLVVTGNGRYAYITNTRSDSVTGLTIAADGSLSLLDPTGHTAATGANPIDMALSVNDRFLYTLNGGDDTISAFEVHADGSLTPLTTFGNLPATLNGLAAH